MGPMQWLVLPFSDHQLSHPLSDANLSPAAMLCATLYQPASAVLLLSA